MSGSAGYASSLFDAVMTRAHEGKDEDAEIFKSNNIISREFCVDSGMIPSDRCALDLRANRIQYGYFIEGTEPKDECKLHKDIIIDARDGMAANVNTPSIFRRKIALVDYEREEKFDFLNIFDRKYLLKSREKN